MRNSNDSLSKVLYSGAFSLGDVTDFKQLGNDFEFECHHARIKLKFVREDIFRLWMAYDGEYTDPAGDAEWPVKRKNLPIENSQITENQENIRPKSLDRCTNIHTD